MGGIKPCELCGKFYKLPDSLFEQPNTVVLECHPYDRNGVYYENERYEVYPDCMKSVEDHIETLRNLSGL